MRTEFILNDDPVALDAPRGLLLDWLREARRLTATKAPCRGGECGGCQVLVGRLDARGRLRYLSHNSCLLPLAALHGSHVLTLEGLNQAGLTPVQQALLEAGAIQCGYCSPGAAIALTGWLLDNPDVREAEGLDWLSGTLCRCTGYGGFHRAVARLAASIPAEADTLARARRLGLLPPSAVEVRARLAAIAPQPPAASSGMRVAGATDLAVEQPQLWRNAAPTPLALPSAIAAEADALCIGAGATLETLRRHPLVLHHAPVLAQVAEVFGSRPIRHQATLGGNLAHASPIADAAVALLALGAELVLGGGGRLPLAGFYTGYKQTALAAGEHILQVRIPLPAAPCHFEKVARREHFDIATVNCAMSLALEGGAIRELRLAAGGVGPMPLRLGEVERAAAGRPLNPALVEALARLAADTIAPIDDVRGSADYRRALMRRLVIAHFETLAPALAVGAASAAKLAAAAAPAANPGHLPPREAHP